VLRHHTIHLYFGGDCLAWPNSGGGTDGSATVTIFRLPQRTDWRRRAALGDDQQGLALPDTTETFQNVARRAIDATHFTYYAANGALAASGGGTAAAAGMSTRVVHQCCVIFQTRQGYYTGAGASDELDGPAGGKQAVGVTNIRPGPLERGGEDSVFLPEAGGASFFYVGGGGTLFQRKHDSRRHTDGRR